MNRIRRAVLLIETVDESGHVAQHGYQITRVDEATISWNRPPVADWVSMRGGASNMTSSGTITVSGEMTGMVRIPSDMFDDEPEIEAGRAELMP